MPLNIRDKARVDQAITLLQSTGYSKVPAKLSRHAVLEAFNNPNPVKALIEVKLKAEAKINAFEQQYRKVNEFAKRLIISEISKEVTSLNSTLNKTWRTINGRLAREASYANDQFTTSKKLRAQGAQAQERIDGYIGIIEDIEAKIHAKRFQQLELVGDTETNFLSFEQISAIAVTPEQEAAEYEVLSRPVNFEPLLRLGQEAVKIVTDDDPTSPKTPATPSSGIFSLDLDFSSDEESEA